jgi:DNA helicase-2/ATP-dependent DNA helicase PcrA
MDEHILAGLNAQQAEAVTHPSGPLLIIAGAGTGKTTVITRRIAYLISCGKAKQDEILALTFTDKAALEMQERVDILVPYGFTDIWISTFHAFGDRVLREHAFELGLAPDFKVLTRPETVVFFREHLFEFELKYYRPLSDPTRFINALVGLFSRAKDEDISPQEYAGYVERLKKRLKDAQEDAALAEEIERQSEIADCYLRYQELLSRQGKVDFANQFYLALKLFRRHPRVLKEYQEKFKYILVDEFQDTNYAQFELVKLLAAKFNNITVVADDDQSIYKWRGAAISNILNFMDTYPEAKKISLTQNYRSRQEILDHAYKLIQFNNPDRFEVKANIDKRLSAIRGRGAVVRHLHFDTVSSESDAVAQMIEEKVKSGKYNFNDFAILVRSNSDADSFLRAMNMRGIPWRFSGNQGLYCREEIRLCIAFLRLMSDLSDSLSLYFLASSQIYQMPIIDLTRCMNYSTRRNMDLFGVFSGLDDIEELQDISSAAREIIGKITQDITKFLNIARTQNTGTLLYKFLTDTNFIRSLVKEPSLENEEKLKNLAKFFGMVRNFETVARKDRVVYFTNYLDMLISAGDDPATVEADLDVQAVNVLTIHKAKGLEFRVVFMVSLISGRFPWPHRREALELPEDLIKDILPSGDYRIQEERRLFYVGMTRAKDELYLTSARDYAGERTRKISRFVIEALELKEDITPKKTGALESIKQNAPRARPQIEFTRKIADDEVINLSYYQIDDYLTCPLKYKYVHILRVPILAHHTVIYGQALHEAVLRYHQFRIKGRSISEDELIEVFESVFRPEGFLAKRHFQQRLEIGRQALRRFYREQEDSRVIPAYVEKEFSVMVDNDRIIGRWDRIDINNGEVVLVDFKSSEIKKQSEADRRTKKNLQLSIYSLAYEKIYGRLPDRVELHFLESGLVGRAVPNQKDLQAAVKKIKEASAGIRSADFDARPAYLACSFCAYNQICTQAVMRKR